MGTHYTLKPIMCSKKEASAPVGSCLPAVGTSFPQASQPHSHLAPLTPGAGRRLSPLLYLLSSSSLLVIDPR